MPNECETLEEFQARCSCGWAFGESVVTSDRCKSCQGIDLVKLANKTDERIARERANAEAQRSAAWREQEEKRLRVIPDLIRERDEAQRKLKDLAREVRSLLDRVDRAKADGHKHVYLATGDGGNAADLRAALVTAGV